MNNIDYLESILEFEDYVESMICPFDELESVIEEE